MGNSMNKDDWEAMPDPAVDEERAREVPCDPLPDLNMDSREAGERYGDQATCQDPGSQEMQQPEAQNQCKAEGKGNNDLAGLSFPRKLWRVVENDAFQSVGWNDDGDAVVIEVDLFQREILSQTDPGRIFETDSLKSFIRQLRLYGFRWIRPHDSEAQSLEVSGDKCWSLSSKIQCLVSDYPQSPLDALICSSILTKTKGERNTQKSPEHRGSARTHLFVQRAK